MDRRRSGKGILKQNRKSIMFFSRLKFDVQPNAVIFLLLTLTTSLRILIHLFVINRENRFPTFRVFVQAHRMRENQRVNAVRAGIYRLAVGVFRSGTLNLGREEEHQKIP